MAGIAENAPFGEGSCQASPVVGMWASISVLQLHTRTILALKGLSK